VFGFHDFKPSLNGFFDISDSFFIGPPLRETSEKSWHLCYIIARFILLNDNMQLHKTTSGKLFVSTLLILLIRSDELVNCHPIQSNFLHNIIISHEEWLPAEVPEGPNLYVQVVNLNPAKRE